MSEATDTGLVVRDTDGQPATWSYDAGLIKCARLYWSLGHKKADIERLMGLPAGTVSQWQTRARPDGEDWEEFRESLMLVPLDRLMRMVGPGNELELREEWLRIGQRVTGIGMAALEHGALMDEDGNEVRHLFDRDGKKVKVGGIRPTNMTQVVAMLRLGTSLAQEQAVELKRVRAEDEMNLDTDAKWMGEMLAEMDKALGQKARRRFLAHLKAGKAGDDVDGDESAESMESDDVESTENEGGNE